MFEKITPEQAGISSRHIADFISYLNRRGMVMHSVLLLRAGKLYGEYYWSPFTQDFCHRMYSQTKSYVSIAIGLLEEEGKLSLDDKIYDYFTDRAPENVPDYIKQQTIRNMLMMCTAAEPDYWFISDDPDRTHIYMSARFKPYPAGTVWAYDSEGSQTLACLVERLSGMKLLDYLKMKLFDKMGTFRTAHILETRNGDSWGDSALICTSRDMASFAQLVMHYGEWEGERLMNERYLREATAKQTSNSSNAIYHPSYSYGYGYQIWRTEQNGFMFNGLGCQLTIMLPDRDMIFVCTADNQGNEGAEPLIINAYFDYIVNHMTDSPLAADAEAEAMLKDMTSDLKIPGAIGAVTMPLAEKINQKVFQCHKSATGISQFSLSFEDGEGVWRWTNAQGDKELRFGLTTNIFQKFPQFGYSNNRGGMRSNDGSLYDCAASGAWLDERTFLLRVQVIDRYFGNLSVMFSYANDGLCYVRMSKNAEDFLNEYAGRFLAEAK